MKGTVCKSPNLAQAGKRVEVKLAGPWVSTVLALKPVGAEGRWKSPQDHRASSSQQPEEAEAAVYTQGLRAAEEVELLHTVGFNIWNSPPQE